MRDNSAENLFQSFLAWAWSQFWDVVHPAFRLLTTVSPTLLGALKDGFGEGVVACDTPEPCTLLSLDSRQRRFLWIHKEVQFASHPVIGLVLQVGNTKKFSHAPLAPAAIS